MMVFNRYQAVAVAADMEKDSSNSSKGGRRLSPEWSQQLGEAALDLLVVAPLEGTTTILVLTHHAVLGYKESGVLKFVKKFEYNPSSFIAFVVGKLV